MTRQNARSITVRLPGMKKADQEVYLELLEAIEGAVRTVLPKEFEWVIESDGRITPDELNDALPAQDDERGWEPRSKA